VARTIRLPDPRDVPPPAPSEWAELLDRAVDEDIVSAEQADRLRALAPAGPAPGAGAPEPAVPRRAFVAEAMGYVGAILVIAAGSTITAQFWADLAPWAHASLLGVLAVVLLAAGGVVQGEAGTPAGRMRSVLWLLAVVAVGGTAAVVADELLDLREAESALAAFGPATAVAIVLWWRLPRSLQQVAVVAGIVGTATAALGTFDLALEELGGLLVWALGIAWLALAWGGLVRPVPTGYVLGAVLALLGPLMVAGMAGRGGLVLGLVTAGALVATSVPARHTVLLWLGVVGLFLYLPRIVLEFFGDQIGAPVALLVSGTVLLGIALWAARVRQDDGEGRGPR
jgi:hypothetical protein